MSSRFKRSRPGSSSFFFALSDLVFGLGLAAAGARQVGPQTPWNSWLPKETVACDYVCFYSARLQRITLWAQHAPNCRQTLHVFQVHTGIFSFSWVQTPQIWGRRVQRPVMTNGTSLPTAAFPTLHHHPVLPLLSLPSRSFAAKTTQRFLNQ